jgi:iron complex transport system substrate-binding protein
MTNTWLSGFCLLLALVALPLPAVQVTDDAGAVVSLAQPARRIVSLAPNITELLFAAGAGDFIIGTVEFSDYPPPARDIPRIGRHNAFDIERILALRPDLVIAWHSGTPRQYVERLRELGLRLYVSEPERLDAIARTLENFGRLTGSATASTAADAFRRQLAALRTRYADRPPLTVFYEIWNTPLMTINHDHILDEILQLCGGRNPFADLPALTPVIDTEAVLAAEPQVIIAASGDDGAGWLDAWRRWPNLPAVRAGNLFHLNADTLHRATPRLLDGAASLCETLDAARQHLSSVD